MRVVICGAGVIGACTAYFLSQRGIEVVVVERTGVACAASGKAGGFLALDWCDGSPLGPLARRSFALHAELAARFPGAWDYRRLDTLAVAASARHRLAGHRADWLAEGAVLRGRLGTPETTAQAHPAKLTGTLLDTAIASGARLRQGRVTGLALTSDGFAVTGAVVDGTTLAADAVLIAMGPWSAEAARWLPLPAVYGLKGNSLVLGTEAPLPGCAIFAEVEGADGEPHAPELFTRPDGTTYFCGLSSEDPVPDDPAAVAPDPDAERRLRAIAAALSPSLAAAPVLAVQACHRPVTRDGLPLIGRVLGVKGAYVATGHGPWGILNAPATGEAMAALITTGDAGPVDLRPFDPTRLRPARGRVAPRP
jgi:glycine/D-amino acid oxidase-like deaminating enzyme